MLFTSYLELFLLFPKMRGVLIVLTMLVASVFAQIIGPSGCGLSSLAPGPGNTAIPNSWPWHSIISRNNDIICGATLINDVFVLTAAACVPFT